MLVSNGRTSVIRGTRKARYKLNGSFIDIFINDGGRERFFAIPIDDLGDILNRDSISGEILVEYDIAADDSTLLEWLEEQRKYLHEAISKL